MNTVLKIAVAALSIVAASATMAQADAGASGTATGPGAGYANTTPDSRNDATAPSSKASGAQHSMHKHKMMKSKPASGAMMTTNPKETGGSNGPTPAN